MSAALLYVDGSGFAQGGPAGVGYVGQVVADGMAREVEGALHVATATNQQAEILAAAYALTEIPVCDEVLVISDSQYLVSTMSHGWNRKANLRHWERLEQAVARHGSVRFSWAKGHNGNPGNERADALAGIAREEA